MKKLLFVLFLMFSTILTFSQWISNYGDHGGDVNFTNAKGNAVTTDANGFSYVTGYTYETASQNDIIVIKYTSTGDTVWVRSYNGNANLNDEGNGICVDALGNVYIVGFAQYTGKSYDVVVLKYTSNGSLSWANQYSSTTAAFMDKGLAIAADLNGFVYVTGFTTNSDVYTDIFVNKYNSTGLIWTSFLEDGPSNLNAQGLSIAVSTTGNVYVTGYVTTSGTNTDIAVIKYNSSGVQQWMNIIPGSGSEEDKAWGIVVDESDNCYITGYITVGANNTDCYTAKFNSAGTIQWSRTYNGGGNQIDKAWGIVVDTDGSVYITGETADASLYINYFTAKYTSTGTSSWASSYNGTGNGEDKASSIGILLNSNNTKSIIVTGKSWGTSSTYDYATVRYSSTTGSQNQVNRYSFSGNSDDLAMDIAVTLNNKVLITGFSQLVFDNAADQSYIGTMSLDWGSELITSNNTPNSFSLYQNYPNPFNPSTNIKFDLAVSSNVRIAVYDVLGKVADVLVDQYLNAGTYNISFSGLSLSSGIYFYELRAGDYREIKKMTLVK